MNGLFTSAMMMTCRLVSVLDKPNYHLRDSIALNIQVKDEEGRPVQGDFSLAVTDDSQVKPDSIGGNILNNLLFTSDLKGNVEEYRGPMVF